MVHNMSPCLNYKLGNKFLHLTLHLGYVRVIKQLLVQPVHPVPCQLVLSLRLPLWPLPPFPGRGLQRIRFRLFIPLNKMQLCFPAI